MLLRRPAALTLLVVLVQVIVAYPLVAQRADSTLRPGAKRDSVIMLAPLEVRASIAPVAGPAIGSGLPARIETIDERALREWRPNILSDVVAMQSNVSLYDDLGSPKKMSLGLRGFAVGPTVGMPAGVSVFVDGIRQNEPDAQEVNFDLLPMDFVKRIELLSGPASLLGPNGLGGAINLITERGEGAPRGEAEIGGGSFNSGSLELSYSGATPHGGTFFAGIGADRSNGWRAETGSDAQRAFFNTSVAGSSRGLSVQGYASRSRAETAGSLPESIFRDSPRTNFTAGDVDDLDLIQLSTTAFAIAGANHWSLTMYARRSHADRFNANQPPDDNVRGVTANVTEGVNADWRRTFLLRGNDLDLRSGVDAAADQVRVRLFDLPSTWIADADSLATDVSSPRTSVAGYAIADLHAGRATLSAGARYDDILVPFHDRLDDANSATSRFTRLTPRFGLNVNVGGGATMYASAGATFRAPALLELGCADPDAACPLPFALGDDPPLAPVRAFTSEAGVKWIMGGVVASASLYRTDVRDEIFFVASEQASLSGYFTNVDRTRRDGGEIDLQGMLGERTFWHASYARASATFQSPTQLFSIRSDDEFENSPLAGTNSVVKGDELPMVPHSMVKVGTDVLLPSSMRAGVEARRIGSQWLRGDEANETRPLDPYTVVDATWSIARGPWLFSGQVHNLFDTHAAIFGTFNENRRTGALERFLTPHDARTIRLMVRVATPESAR
jgi:iron complex outermembrane receptor protein